MGGRDEVAQLTSSRVCCWVVARSCCHTPSQGYKAGSSCKRLCTLSRACGCTQACSSAGQAGTPPTCCAAHDAQHSARVGGDEELEAQGHSRGAGVVAQQGLHHRVGQVALLRAAKRQGRAGAAQGGGAVVCTAQTSCSTPVAQRCQRAHWTQAHQPNRQRCVKTPPSHPPAPRLQTLPASPPVTRPRAPLTCMIASMKGCPPRKARAEGVKSWVEQSTSSSCTTSSCTR